MPRKTRSKLHSTSSCSSSTSSSSEIEFICKYCDKSYRSKAWLTRHIKTCEKQLQVESKNKQKHNTKQKDYKRKKSVSGSTTSSSSYKKPTKKLCEKYTKKKPVSSSTSSDSSNVRKTGLKKLTKKKPSKKKLTSSSSISSSSTDNEKFTKISVTKESGKPKAKKEKVSIPKEASTALEDVETQTVTFVKNLDILDFTATKISNEDKEDIVLRSQNTNKEDNELPNTDNITKNNLLSSVNINQLEVSDLDMVDKQSDMLEQTTTEDYIYGFNTEPDSNINAITLEDNITIQNKKDNDQLTIPSIEDTNRIDYIISNTPLGYLCKWCTTNKNNYYILEKQLMNHLKDAHPKEYVLTKLAMSYCFECSKQFDNQGAYNTHKKARHNEKIAAFKCEKCTQTFDKLHNLNRHEREDHPEEHKDLLGIRSTCTLCERTFKNYGALKTHMIHKHPDRVDTINSGASKSLYEAIKNLEDPLEKLEDKEPYRCDQCDKTYIHQTNLTRHKKETHGYITGKKGPKNVNGVHKCKECTESYSNRSSLSRHYRKMHKDSYIFVEIEGNKCKRCGKEFDSITAVRTHYAKVHSIHSTAEKQPENKESKS